MCLYLYLYVYIHEKILANSIYTFHVYFMIKNKEMIFFFHKEVKKI